MPRFHKQPRRSARMLIKGFLPHRVAQFFGRFSYRFKTMSLFKHILLFYLVITVVGALLLDTSAAQTENGVGYTDSFFTAASAFSNTGLSSVVIGADFSLFGQAIIAILIIIGGVGWFSLKVYIFNIFFKRPIPLGTRLILSQERGTTNTNISPRIIAVSITCMFLVMLVAAVGLSVYFYYVPGNFENPVTWLGGKNNSTFENGHWGFLSAKGTFIPNDHFDPYGNWSMSVRYGLFHGISALNNAGFTIMGAHSLAPYYSDYTIQIIFMGLFVFGGIGFPVIYDVFQWSHSKVLGSRLPFRFSLFTKLSTSAYFVIAVLGLAATFGIELTHNPQFAHQNKTLWGSPEFGNTGHKVMAIIFNTFSTRNAGFSTVNYQVFSGGTLIVHSVLMFIGSAPSSTGGGVRTTTVAIAFLSIYTFIRNKSTVRAFNRQIKRETVTRSFVVIVTAAFLVLLVSLICQTSLSSYHGDAPYGYGLNKYNFLSVLFEVTSAFGTTGLSTGLTHHLNVTSKIFLTLTMFIGQLGVSSTLLFWNRKNPKSRHYRFYTENVAIG